MIDDPTRRADDDLGTTLQCRQLLAIILTATEGGDFQPFQVLAVLGERHGDLLCQFPRRGQHEDLRFTPAEVEPAQQRQRERGGLAGTGLRLAQHVATFQQRRDGLRLDR